MFSNTGSFKPRALVLPALLLFTAGWLARALEPPVTTPREGNGEQWMAAAGQGGLPLLPDGVRPVIAGAFWLRANLAWERRDEAATRALLELTVAADERPAYFWLNGARMLAYDMPGWESGPIASRQRRGEQCARRALDFLEKGLRWRGDDAGFFIEMANVHLRRRGDLEKAADYYGRAARQPGAPYYAARIHAELLRALGRPEEALAWLRQVLPTLPADDPAARREAVMARIGALEREVAGR